MKWNWEELFGNEYYIELKNDERKYFGLDEIAPEWETSEFFSKTNICYNRTVVFWDKDTIRKVILEENRLTEEGVIVRRSHCEYDTVLQTENREMILPLTERGKKKKLTPTNINNVAPFGCSFFYSLDATSDKPKACIRAYNSRNNQELAIGEEEKVCRILTPADFRAFIEEYVRTCPEYYFDRVNRMRTEKHKTLKYRVGDIFRVEADRFNYCYGLITGEVKKIRKWPELPERHSISALMMVPLMIRFYDIVTPNGNLTADELKNIPLGRLQLCVDNDIIWGTHPIIDHKELEADDIEFNLVCTKVIGENKHCTVFTQDFLIKEKLIAMPEEYSIYVEWGTAAATIPYTQISERLRELMADYHSPHGGVAISIFPRLLMLSEEKKKEYFDLKYNLHEEHNSELRGELFACLGLSSDADFDDFADKFGGLQKAEILKRLTGKQ